MKNYIATWRARDRVYHIKASNDERVLFDVKLPDTKTEVSDCAMTPGGFRRYTGWRG